MPERVGPVKLPRANAEVNKPDTRLCTWLDIKHFSIIKFLSFRDSVREKIFKLYL